MDNAAVADNDHGQGYGPGAAVGLEMRQERSVGCALASCDLYLPCQGVAGHCDLDQGEQMPNVGPRVGDRWWDWLCLLGGHPRWYGRGQMLSRDEVQVVRRRGVRFWSIAPIRRTTRS